jgi:hypothetical protein
MDAYEWKDADGESYGIETEGIYWQKSYNERYQLVEGIEAGDDAILQINSGASDEILRLADRVRELEEARPLTPFERIAADRLADEVASLVSRHLLDSRSAAADALLDYREPPRSARSDRIAALEEEVEAELRGQVEISTSNGHAFEKWQERERKLREALAPVLAAFEERAAAWDRMRVAFDDTGWSGPPPVMDPRITLTAEFEVETLRALLKEE